MFFSRTSLWLSQAEPGVRPDATAVSMRRVFRSASIWTAVLARVLCSQHGHEAIVAQRARGAPALGVSQSAEVALKALLAR